MNGETRPSGDHTTGADRANEGSSASGGEAGRRRAHGAIAVPERWRQFRTAISVLQIFVMLGVATGIVLVLMTDNRGLNLWNDYFALSQGFSSWANEALKLPWE